MNFEIYQDKRGEWRWRLRHSNGRIMADSGEGYSRRSDCRKGFDRVAAMIAAGKVQAS